MPRPKRKEIEDMAAQVKAIHDKLAGVEYSSDIPPEYRKNDAPTIKQKVDQYPNGERIVRSQEIVPKETSQQRHEATPGSKTRKDGEQDARTNWDPIRRIFEKERKE